MFTHGRLGRVNYDILHKLIKLDHIPAFKFNSNHKYKTCAKAKLTRTSF